MGMMENEKSGPGWYNLYNWDVYVNNGGAEGADAESRAYIKERLGQFADNPALMIGFYNAKLITQWADPLFNVLSHVSYGDDAHPVLLRVIGQWGENKPLNVHLYRITDIMQSIVFAGGNICLIIMAVLHIRKRDENPEYLLSAVITVTGGVLFSMLWEAKSRYVIGYYELIMLMSCVGYSYAACMISGRIRKAAEARRHIK